MQAAESIDLFLIFPPNLFLVTNCRFLLMGELDELASEPFADVIAVSAYHSSRQHIDKNATKGSSRGYSLMLA